MMLSEDPTTWMPLSWKSICCVALDERMSVTRLITSCLVAMNAPHWPTGGNGNVAEMRPRIGRATIRLRITSAWAPESGRNCGPRRRSHSGSENHQSRVPMKFGIIGDEVSHVRDHGPAEPPVVRHVAARFLARRGAGVPRAVPAVLVACGADLVNCGRGVRAGEAVCVALSHRRPAAA